MVREPPVSGDPVGAAKRARCERAGALRLLGDDTLAGRDPSCPGCQVETVGMRELGTVCALFLCSFNNVVAALKERKNNAHTVPSQPSLIPT